MKKNKIKKNNNKIIRSTHKKPKEPQNKGLSKAPKKQIFPCTLIELLENKEKNLLEAEDHLFILLRLSLESRERRLFR